MRIFVLLVLLACLTPRKSVADDLTKDRDNTLREAVILERQRPELAKEARERAKKQQAEELQQLRVLKQHKQRDDAEMSQKHMSMITITERANAIRVVDGTAYDFYPVFAAQKIFSETMRRCAANKAEAIRCLSNSTGSLTVVTHDYNVAVEDAHRHFQGYQRYLLTGRVSQVLGDGLLVECRDSPECGYKGTVFVKGYEHQDIVTNGAEISAIGLPRGYYQYNAVIEKPRTLNVFSCARIPDKFISAFEAQPLP